MIKTLMAVVVAGALGTAVYAADQKAADACPATPGCCAPTTAPTTQAAVNTICPITREAVDPKVTTVHDGKTVAFCCASCIDTFNKNPEQHMKDLK